MEQTKQTAPKMLPQVQSFHLIFFLPWKKEESVDVYDMHCICVCDAYFELYRPAVAVDVILHIYTHCAGAFIQNSKLWFVVEESGHLHTQTEMDTFIYSPVITEEYNSVIKWKIINSNLQGQHL